MFVIPGMTTQSQNMDAMECVDMLLNARECSDSENVCFLSPRACSRPVRARATRSQNMGVKLITARAKREGYVMGREQKTFRPAAAFFRGPSLGHFSTCRVWSGSASCPKLHPTHRVGYGREPAREDAGARGMARSRRQLVRDPTGCSSWV